MATCGNQMKKGDDIEPAHGTLMCSRGSEKRLGESDSYIHEAKGQGFDCLGREMGKSKKLLAAAVYAPEPFKTALESPPALLAYPSQTTI